MSINKVSSFLFAKSLNRQAELSGKPNAEVPPSTVQRVEDEAAVLSTKSKYLREMTDRRSKVEALKEQVQSGTYQGPDSNTLASSFLQELYLG